MTRRHPDHALVSNPQDTTPPRRRAAQQFAWHSGTHATRPPAIPMAQRRTRHTHDTPDANPHSLPLRSTAQRRTHDTPDTACRCISRNVRSKLTSTNPQIPCACPDFATPNTRTHARTANFSHRATKFQLPRTIPCASDMHPESHTRHAKRMSQRVISCVHATRPDANPHSTAPPTQPAACPRHTLRHTRHARDPQPATRNARSPCVHATRPKPNPHGTAPRMPTGTLKHARSPQPATRTRQKCARHHTHTHARSARGATARASLTSQIPAQGHGFENLVVATPPP